MGGTGVSVGGTAVGVDGTDVAASGTGVAAGGTGVSVGEEGVAADTTDSSGAVDVPPHAAKSKAIKIKQSTYDGLWCFIACSPGHNSFWLTIRTRIPPTIRLQVSGLVHTRLLRRPLSLCIYR